MSTSPRRSSRTVQNAKDLLATKNNQVWGTGRKGYFHWRSSQECSCASFQRDFLCSCSDVLKSELWLLQIIHLCDKQLSKPSASAANLSQTRGEVDPHVWAIVSLKRALKKTRFVVSLIIYSGLHHLKVDFVSGCCHSEWKSKHPAPAFVYTQQPAPQPRVQLETQLKPAQICAPLCLRWTTAVIWADRKHEVCKQCSKKREEMLI